MESENLNHKNRPGQTNSRRSFIKKGLIGLAGAGVLYKVGDYFTDSNAKGKIVIVGGGAAGITMAAYLSDMLRDPDITLIEPKRIHHYQPGYTFIAGGVFDAEDVTKPNADLIPKGVNWMQDSVKEIHPDANKLKTVKNGTVSYDFLVMVPGCQLNFDLVEGITREELGKGNVHCIYDFKGAQRTYRSLQDMRNKGEGKMVFTNTYTKVKCGGAPKKITLIADDLFRDKGVRDRFDFDFYSNSTNLMRPAIYGDRLAEIYDERNIQAHFLHRLKSVDTAKKEATFELIPEASLAPVQPGANLEQVKVDFDFLHFLPPMSAPDFVKNSALAITEGSLKHGGWIDVDKATMVHKKYKNIISFGDASGLPTSKTGAAIRIQAPIAAQNLVSIMEGKTPDEYYNGYTACPIVTENGKVLMCEFKYDKELDPSIPWLDPGVERGMWWILKKHGLKPMYYYGMLKGLM